jgi:hypothetical protein
MAEQQDSKSQGDQSAVKSNVQAPGEVTRQGAEAVEQAGRATSDVLRQGAGLGAEATQRGAEAGSEAVRRAGDTAGETVRRGAQAVAESQRQLVQDATEQLQEVSRKVAQAVRGTTEDVRTLMVLPSAAKGGLREVQQSVTGLVEGVVRTNLRATQELIRLANPSAFVELQQRFVREYLDVVMEGSATLVRGVRRTADQTLGPIEEQIEQRRRAHRGQQHHQNAAE